MIVHIFPYEKFTLNFIQFIKNNFSAKEHIFVLSGGNKEWFDRNEVDGVVLIDFEKNKFKALKALKDADGIIAHSLFFKTSLLSILTVSPTCYKKMAWVCWGGEIEFLKTENFSDMKQKVKKFIMRRFIKKIKAIIVLAAKDYDKIEELVNISKRYFSISYGNGRILNVLSQIDEKANEKVRDVEEIRILIGNSATVTNNHLEIFDILDKFKDDNIKIFVPLSYGEEAYKDEVIRIGKKKFGDKFIPLLDFMEYEDYLTFLESMDITVFNNSRQQGLGNIRASLYFGNKVYLRPDTSMGEEFFRNFDVFSIFEMEKFSLDDLKKISQESKLKNRESILEIYNEKKIAENWNEIFSYISLKKE